MQKIVSPVGTSRLNTSPKYSGGGAAVWGSSREVLSFCMKVALSMSIPSRKDAPPKLIICGMIVIPWRWATAFGRPAVVSVMIRTMVHLRRGQNVGGV